MAGWKSISTNDYYGEFEELPWKHKIKAAPVIDVLWPDGSITSGVTVRKRDGSGSAQVDMNNFPDHFTTRKLYFTMEIHGKQMKIPLKGFKIRKHLS